MDYTKFLGKKDEAILAYLGGAYAYGKDRRMRIAEPRPALGFHKFEIKGRVASVVETADSPDFGKLPRVRGHFVRGWVISSDLKSRAERIELLPTEEPAPFALVRARRWHSGDLVFESLDFDTDVEDAARLRLEEKAPLGAMKGMPLSLRTAYGVALAFAFAADMTIPISVREALAGAAKIAESGEPVARQFLDALHTRRVQEIERARIRAIVEGRRPGPPAPGYRAVAYRTPARDAPTVDNAAERVEQVLDAARARMLACRNLGDGNIEVTWTFMGQRLISVVEAITLHVYDSGVCLAGEDELVTLDALPGVIREAIDTDRLVITRH